MLSSLGNEIEEFKAAPRGHLFVAGRFDGMDFKADECRLVVLATLPKAINIQEEFCTSHLRDASFMMQRLNQRIIQALGRCNRAPDDFAGYILADRRFATHFGRESHRAGIPPNMAAEIDSAEDATELEVGELSGRVTSFLRGEFAEFDRDLEEHRAALPPLPTQGRESVDTSEDEVLGWMELFESRNYPRAQRHFGRCAENAGSQYPEHLVQIFDDYLERVGSEFHAVAVTNCAGLEAMRVARDWR